MKRISTIFIISSFIAILFGSFYMTENGFNCLASKLNNAVAPCPVSDPFGFADFNNNAIKKISSLTLVDSVMAGYLALFASFTVFIRILFRAGRSSLIPMPAFISAKELISKNSSAYSEKLGWFSRHENSPSLF